MKYLDLFAGYGGFSLGIQQAYEDYQAIQCSPEQLRSGLGSSSNGDMSDSQRKSWENTTCIGFSEVDRYAIQVYNKHFNHKNYGDIKTINPAELPDFDLLCGGFPCQAFSIAGKRGGFDDTRGTLIYDVFRILKEKHPRWVLLENVKGLLSHDGGRTFKTIITALAELGYAVEWQVLNAKNFGVPQNRERVFIIGHLGGFGGRQVFPIGSDSPENSKIHKGTPQVASTINATYSRNQSDAQYVQPVQSGLRQVRELPDNTDSRGGQTHPTDFRIRRLTPTETERLMGLPDGWTEGVSDTRRYQLCGNGVVVNVVKEIIKNLIKSNQ